MANEASATRTSTFSKPKNKKKRATAQMLLVLLLLVIGLAQPFQIDEKYRSWMDPVKEQIGESRMAPSVGFVSRKGSQLQILANEWMTPKTASLYIRVTEKTLFQDTSVVAVFINGTRYYQVCFFFFF